MLFKPNFLIHLTWAVLGTCYLAATIISGGNLFFQFDDLSADLGLEEYAFVGNALPAFLTAFSIVGIISLSHIPFSCDFEFSFKDRFVWFFNKGTYTFVGIIVLVLGICAFPHLIEKFLWKDAVDYYLFFVSVAVPFLFIWLYKLDFLNFSDYKAAWLLLAGTLFSLLAGIIAFVVSMFKYDATYAMFAPWIILSIGAFIVGPPTYYYIVIVRRD